MEQRKCMMERPLLKSTSLKATPTTNSIISNGHHNRHERKVRFADALGLDLVSIFLSSCQYSILSSSPTNNNSNSNINNNNNSNSQHNYLMNDNNNNNYHNRKSDHHTINNNNNVTNTNGHQNGYHYVKHQNGYDLKNGDVNEFNNFKQQYNSNNNYNYYNNSIISNNNISHNGNNNTSHGNNNNNNNKTNHINSILLNNNNHTNHANYNHYYNNSMQICNGNHRHYSPQKQSSLPTMMTSASSSSLMNASPRKIFSFDYPQPVSMISFHERVKRNKVSLETCNITNRAGNVSIICSVRVVNISYEKSVIVRFTTNEWSTWTDSLASYVPESCDGWSDKFTSTFSITNAVKQFLPGQRVIFAIRFTANNEVFWDNNNGENYILRRI